MPIAKTDTSKVIEMWTLERRLRLLVPALSMALLSELLVTPGLWMANRGFPTVPILGALPQLAQIPTLALAFGMAITAVAFACWPSRRWIGAFTVGIGCVLVAFDVNRLQPWLYIYLAMLLILAIERQPDAAWTACGVVLIGTYFWSGIQKLNPAFASQILPKLCEPFGPQCVAIARSCWLVAPVWETAIGIALLFPRARSIGLAGCVVIHGFLLASLGPFGLNYNSAIWPWNFWAPVIAFLVFFQSNETVVQTLLARPVGVASFVLFGFAPVLSFVGVGDGYLSDRFYSGKLSSGWIYLKPEGSKRLRAIFPDASAAISRLGPGVEVLDLTQWSLNRTNAPPFPESWVYVSIYERLRAYGLQPEDMRLLISIPGKPTR